MQASLNSHNDSSGEDALQLMSSSTIADRNKGIQEFSDLLSNPSNMASLKESKWATIFHQLFASAELEKSALVKQSASGKSAASKAGNLKRLKAVAGLIRTCTAQFAPAFKQKVLKLVMHRSIELALSANRTLMDAIAWDCIRIFRDLLLYRPHLEHLQPKTCAELLAICFAAILDKKLPRTLTLAKDVDYVDDGIPLVAPDSLTASAAMNPQILDSARLLSLILSSPSSLCLEHSKSLLHNLHKVLLRFPRETSAHLDFISALHTLLRELELNRGHELSRYSVELGDCLVALWPTKTNDLKEQIILCLTYLFPFVVPDVESSHSGAGEVHCKDGEQLVKKVFEVISNDKEQRAGMDLISLGALNLSVSPVPPTAANQSILSTTALCRATGDGSNLVAERNQVMTWAALVLGAHALKSIAHLADRFVPREHRSPRKRRKVDDELELFFQRMKPGRPTPSVVHRLQLLTVATDRHWRSLNPSTRSQIVGAVMELLHSDDSEVLDWVFIFMGNLAYCQQTLSCTSNETNSTNQTSPSNGDWGRLWSYAIRRTAHPPCCRSASYVALCILITHRIPVHTAHDGICGFLRDLYVQGPAFPYDSVCMLVSECLAFASDNMRLSAHSLEEKALIWLSKIWPEVDRAAATTRDLGGNSQRSRRPIPEGFDSEAFARLLLSIAKLRQFPRLTPVLIVPDCATTEAFTYIESTQRIRSSTFNQDIFDPVYVSSIETALCRPSDKYHTSSALMNPHSTSNPVKQISSMLRQSIERLIDETGRTDKSCSVYLSVAKCAHVKMAISILIAALLYGASCEECGSSHSRENNDTLATFLGIVTHLVEAPEWTPPERAILFACFGPIVLPSLDTLPKNHCRGIAFPGRASGLSFKQRAALGPDDTPVKTEVEYEGLGSKVWSLNSAVRCQLENFLAVCERLLGSLSSTTSSNVSGTAVDAKTQVAGRWNVFDDNDEDVEMTDIQYSREGSTFSNSGGTKKKALRTGLGAVGHPRATLAVTDICIRALVTDAKISMSSIEKEHLNSCSRILSVLENCTGSDIIFVGFPVFNCLSARSMTMTANQINRMLEHLGDTYLTTYAHSQNVEIRRLTLQLLKISIPYWNNVDIEGGENVGSTARVLCQYMASQMLRGNTRSWQVQHEFNILLDAYLEYDPLQASWASNMSSTAAQGAEGDLCLPVDLMLQSLQDEDHRVRHGATLIVPRVFELMHTSQHDPVHHWKQILKHLPPSSSGLEIMLTRSLCIVNTLVLSEEIRPRAYHKLLDILTQPLETQEDILHHNLAHQLLQRTALQLGFTDIGKLYQLYAAHVAAERGHMKEPALHVAEKFVGKRLDDRQKTRAARDHLLATGAHFYFNNSQAFQTSARLAGLKEDEALRLCSPRIVAELLSRACFQTSPENASIDIDSQVQSKLKKITASTGLEDILNSECDRVIVHLMSSAYIKPQDLDLFIKVFMEDPRSRNVLEVLISRLRKCRICEPALPFYPIWCIAKAMKWVGQRYPVFTEPALAYSIICYTFASFLHSPFINDRLRTLYSLSVYMSFSHIIIANSLPILSLLLQGLLPLISDENLFQPVCTLVKWVLAKILQPSNWHLKGYPLLSWYIISTVEAIKRVADSVSSSEPDVSVGQDFIAWLLDHVVKTKSFGATDYHNLCHSLLLHWPEKLPILAQIWGNDSALVNHCLASPSSFKLIHHLSDYCLPEQSIEAGTILYNLLVSARQMKSELRAEDCKAYLKLLYKNSGILTAPRLGQAIPVDSESYLERVHSLTSENDIISRIFAIAVSRLQTLDFQFMILLTEFIRKASNFENCPDFADQFCRVPELLAGRAALISHTSLSRAYDTHCFSKPGYLSDFSTLDNLAHSSNHWTLAFLQLLIASRAETRPFYTQLAPVIEIDDELAAKVLEPVLHACLLNEVEARQSSSLKKAVSKHFLNILQSPSTDRVVITRVLELVIYLRCQRRPGSDPLGHDKWLEVDWIEFTKHATRLGMSASAFLFIELGREHGFLDDFPMTAGGGGQSIFEQLYATAPEPDTFYSLLSNDPRSSLLQRYQHESQWEFAFALHGAMLEGSDIKSSAFSEGIPSIARYLSSYGLNRLAHSVLQTHSLSMDHHDLDADEAVTQPTLPYELAWRASTWDLPVTDRLDVDASTRLYGALQYYNREREQSRRAEVLETCLLGQFKELTGTTIARAQPSSKIVGSALALTDIALWSSLERGKPLKADALESLLCLPSGCDYEIIERISAVRRSLLQPVINQQSLVPMGEELKHTIRVARETDLQIRIRTSREARLSGHLQSALNVITPFAEFGVDTESLVVLRAREEFAEVLWAKGEQSLALNTLKGVQASQKSLPESAVQLSRLGEWIAVAKLQSPTDIVNLYFEKAIQLLDNAKHPEAFGRVCFTFAKFADKQYRELLESRQVTRLMESTQRLEAEVQATQNPTDEDGKKAAKWKNRIYQEDKAKLDSLSQLQARYLSSALKMYLNSLAYEDQHDDVVFRFVSLWFEQHSDNKMNKELRAPVNSVPTFKFVRVAHQLSARLSQDPQSEFQLLLGQLVTRLCGDHPFHTMFQILLLQRGIKSSVADVTDTPLRGRSRRVSQKNSEPTQLNVSESSRAKAADTVLLAIHNMEKRRGMLQELLVAHKAYNEWAMCDVTKIPEFQKAGRSGMELSSRYLLTALKDLSIPVSTVSLPIDKTRRYLPEHMVCINGYNTKFRIAGGVHKPKITDCRGSDGRVYPQLFKGGDDVRQDAVMEQVFELVNEVLKRDPECRKRRLNFRTYCVIPLSPLAGLIEFVTNTLSLMDVLSPLHKKYNEPLDWDWNRIQNRLMSAQAAPVQDRIKKYKEVRAHVRPAMRFWFMENQKCPQDWYEMRLNYTRTTATASIVGYILGLGDRHLHNILLDKVSGEMVQIDLGIAFDGGKQLRLPETVPFRLTPDIIDGFGITKTDGVFRRCCEQTLRVLRVNKSLIMTIIDVLKHDPLHAWVITEEKAKEMQGQEYSEFNHPKKQEGQDGSEPQVSEYASRALASVENKLGADLSIETTVNLLILEATNPENLGALYVGWAPCH